MSKRKQSTYGKIGGSKKRKLDLMMIQIEKYRVLVESDEITAEQLMDYIDKSETIMPLMGDFDMMERLLELIVRTGKFLELRDIILPNIVYNILHESLGLIGLVSKVKWVPVPLISLLVSSVDNSISQYPDDDLIEMREKMGDFDLVNFCTDKRYYNMVKYWEKYYYNVALFIAISNPNVGDWTYEILFKSMRSDNISVSKMAPMVKCLYIRTFSFGYINNQSKLVFPGDIKFQFTNKN